MNVAVIGSGIVGASVAFRLAQNEQTEVIIIDRDKPGSGTTSASFAWLNANQKTPREYYELNRVGMEEHFRLKEELGEAPWLHPGGNLVWTEDEEELDELERRVERLLSWDYAAQWLGASQVNDALEPRVAFPNPETPVAYFPQEAWVDAPQLARTLVRLAEAHGARARFDAPVASLETRGGCVASLWLEDGEKIPVDVVVNAAGPSADQVASEFGLKLRLAPTSGLLVRLAVGEIPIRRLLHAPSVNVRPDRPGRVLLHHASIDQRLWDGKGKETLSAELLERAQRVLPTLKDSKISEVLVGVRPMPEDGFSCFGAVTALAGYYEAVTHSGVTLGPLIGRLLAQEILTGQVDPLAAAFRPDRFARAEPT